MHQIAKIVSLEAGQPPVLDENATYWIDSISGDIPVVRQRVVSRVRPNTPGALLIDTGRWPDEGQIETRDHMPVTAQVGSAEALGALRALFELYAQLITAPLGVAIRKGNVDYWPFDVLGVRTFDQTPRLIGAGLGPASGSFDAAWTLRVAWRIIPRDLEGSV